jgi:hypothetical protein
MPGGIGERAQNWIPKFQKPESSPEMYCPARRQFLQQGIRFSRYTMWGKNRAKDGGEKSVPIQSNQNPGLSNRYHADVLVIEFNRGTASKFLV